VKTDHRVFVQGIKRLSTLLLLRCKRSVFYNQVTRVFAVLEFCLCAVQVTDFLRKFLVCVRVDVSSFCPIDKMSTQTASQTNSVVGVQIRLRPQKRRRKLYYFRPTKKARKH